jgi:hypothetical protein
MNELNAFDDCGGWNVGVPFNYLRACMWNNENSRARLRMIDYSKKVATNSSTFLMNIIRI